MGAVINSRRNEQRPVEPRRQHVAQRFDPLVRDADGVGHEDVKRQPDAEPLHAPGGDILSHEEDRRLSVHTWHVSVPQAIISSAIKIGASTGPHHGSGMRNRMSQSSSERGQPHHLSQKHVVEDVPHPEGDRRSNPDGFAGFGPPACPPSKASRGSPLHEAPRVAQFR